MNRSSQSNHLSPLYPDIEPYKTGKLDVGDGHSLYYECSGNPNGQPVVVLHGGPGGGSSPGMRRFFNPDKWHIILFDQRGCGQSTPHASLEHNTTWHSVGDIEKLRGHLGIASWAVFGGSWGSTLSLAYTIKHADHITALFLRGIFLLRDQELKWFYQEGASNIYPDMWQDYLAPIPENERGDLITAFYKRLTSEDAEVRKQAATAWARWEGNTLSLNGPSSRSDQFENDDFLDAFARIECHYFVNKGFFDDETWWHTAVEKARDIPTWIIQGRYDVVTPATTAWDLHSRWPEAHFQMIQHAGHAASDTEIARALVTATDTFVSTEQ